MSDEREQGRPRKYDHIPNSDLYQKPVWWVAKEYGITERTVYTIRDNRRRRGQAEEVITDLIALSDKAFKDRYGVRKRAMRHDWESDND
jgi:hypothetical protein